MALDTKPWYKQFWLWFLLSIPIASIILSTIMVTTAFNSEDSLVSDDYYKDGIGINRVIEQEQAATARRLIATVNTRENGDLSIQLQGQELDGSPLQQEAFLEIQFAHPTKNGLDTRLRLLPEANNQFSATLPTLPAGRWHTKITNPQSTWKISAKLTLPITQATHLSNF